MSLTVVVAPDSFKGSLSAAQVAEQIAVGWRSVRPDDNLVLVPQADGGEGTLDAVQRAIPGSRRHSTGPVVGPDGRPTEGEWVELPGGIAVVELAQMSGLPLMHNLDPRGSGTRGLGQVIRAALDAGATSLLIGLGGSASTDGGAGALAALGAKFLDTDGVTLPDGGAALARLATIDLSALLPAPAGGITLLTDVTAPLLGPLGAAAVFSPQKGADEDTVAELEIALAHLHRVLGGDAEVPGAGAAGGCAFGLQAAWGATIRPGWDYLAEIADVRAAIAGADVLLTGEGRFDEQSLRGKVVGQLLGVAASHGVASGVIAGQLTAGPGVWSKSLVTLAGSVEAAMADPARWLRAAGTAAASTLPAGTGQPHN